MDATSRARSEQARKARRRQRVERAIAVGITAVGLTGIALVVLILVFVGKEALPLLTDPAARAEASLAKMFLPQIARIGRPAAFIWQPVSSVPKVSMVPLMVGTLKVTLVSMALAVPLGVGAALFASEFAPRRLRELLKPAIELLAGVPSVVLGFFALMVLASVMQPWFGWSFRLNAAVAGVALSLAIVPVIFTVSEDALNAVPKSYREAALALGATRWETAWKVVLPAAAPGILAACVLGFGRAIGETMIVLMASGNAAMMSWSVGESVRSMSATIAAEMGEVVVGSTHYSTLFFIGVELFAVTFLINLLAGAWVRRVVRRLGGHGVSNNAFRRGFGASMAALTGLCALLILAMLGAILFDVVRGGWAHLSWEFLSSPPTEGMTAGGIFPAIYGTVALTLLMTLAVMPVGVITAIYLHEYAPPDSKPAAWVRIAIHNLAGVPSIVFGLFGLGFFIHFIGGTLDALGGSGAAPKWGQPGILWASLTLAVLTLPVVIVATEEALRAVPLDHRTASLALGATRSQTLARVVLPGALPGILTGAVLAVSRGAGEVAPILLTGAAYYLPDLPTKATSQFMHLGYHTYVLATQSPDVEATRPLLYSTVLVLLALTFALNLLAVAIRTRTRRRAAAGH